MDQRWSKTRVLLYDWFYWLVRLPIRGGFLCFFLWCAHVYFLCALCSIFWLFNISIALLPIKTNLYYHLVNVTRWKEVGCFISILKSCNLVEVKMLLNGQPQLFNNLHWNNVLAAADINNNIAYLTMTKDSSTKRIVFSNFLKPPACRWSLQSQWLPLHWKNIVLSSSSWYSSCWPLVVPYLPFLWTWVSSASHFCTSKWSNL